MARDDVVSTRTQTTGSHPFFKVAQQDRRHAAPEATVAAEPVGEDGDHPPAEGKSLAAHGLAPEGDGLQEVLRADVVRMSPAAAGDIQQGIERRFESLHEVAG